MDATVSPQGRAPQAPSILIVEDHPVTLEGILAILHRFYPEATLFTAGNQSQALEQINHQAFELVILDLQIPQEPDQITRIETGVQFLKDLMSRFPKLNIAVQSSYLDALARIRPDIDNHQGGFTVVDKGRSTQETFERFDCALKGYTHTRDIRGLQAGLEVKPEWLKTLILACQEGLQDRAIAKELHVSESMIRNYWTKIYDVLSIYPEDEKEEGKNLRILSCVKARKEGLID